MGSELENRIRNVTAVLGPTNTGKTHLAIERMLGHESGMIGLPLRLLAREVYDKIAARVGPEKVALITGEEKIKPERARYWVCTVEAMPRDVDVEFLAIDEIQLCADPERGHVFTDRLLHARGKSETLVLGAQTMREAISELIPGANFISRPRLSKLTYAGQKKITRLPTRSAIVTFSANDVYAVAELIRRQRGGAAVVLGALSPRTRNAQVALYQSGDVDFLVATDAVGMGLNLDVDHVAFAAVRKFDGQNHRNLTPAELGQIAGRAGRHMNDGTFGVTASVEPLEADLIERLENHTFDQVKVLQWRNRKLDFNSLDRLRDSLRELPNEQRLTRARMADDVLALETVSSDRDVVDLISSPSAVGRLWEVCQIPDYRKISPQNHAELVGTLYKFLQGAEERIPEDWFAKQVAFADRTDGDIDTLANRIAHIRTWTFVSNRADWLKDPEHWQGRTREIEDALSDALHECLTQRFVDRRTSALMRGMRDKEELNAEIGDDGAINVESHYVGRIKGFSFTPDAQAEGIHGKAARHAATQVVTRELAMRAPRVPAAKDEAFKLNRAGRVLWRDEEIARLDAADDVLKPSLTLIADESMSAPDKEKVQARLDSWISDLIADRLKPLVDIAKAEDITGLARGIAFRLTENFGVLKRDSVADEMRSLDQTARAQLRKYGVRFGAFNIFFPLLLKPAAAELSLTLWALKHAAALGLSSDNLPAPPRPGLTSVKADAAVPEAFYRVLGYHVCGPRAVRVDILERLADLIRPLLAFRQNPESPSLPPRGSTGDGGFTVMPEMMSFLGCSGEELSNVLKALGFRVERRPVKQIVLPPRKKPENEPPAADAAVASASAPTGEQATGEPPEPSAEASEPSEPVTGEAAAAPAAEAAQPEPATQSVADAAAPVAEAGAAAETVTAVELVAAPEAAPGEVAAEAAPAEAGAAAEAEKPAEKAEPPMIDVWRPRRRRDEEQQRGRRHERGGERPERSEGGPPRRERGGRDRGGERRGGGGRPHNRDRNQPAASETPAVAAVASGDAAVATAAPATEPAQADAARPRHGDRPQHRDRDANRGREQQGRGDRGRDNRDQNRGRSDRDNRFGGGGRPGGNDRRRDDRSGGPPIRSASPTKKGGADPDSPFAALSALKMALEKQARDPKP